MENNQSNNVEVNQEEGARDAVVTIRCLSAVPLDLKNLLEAIEAEEQNQ